MRQKSNHPKDSAEKAVKDILRRPSSGHRWGLPGNCCGWTEAHLWQKRMSTLPTYRSNIIYPLTKWAASESQRAEVLGGMLRTN